MAVPLRPRTRIPILLLLVAALTDVARGQTVTEFPIPTANSGSYGIAAGPDGNLWFTEVQANQIGRITTYAPPSPRTLPVPVTEPQPEPRTLPARPTEGP